MNKRLIVDVEHEKEVVSLLSGERMATGDWYTEMLMTRMKSRPGLMNRVIPVYGKTAKAACRDVFDRMSLDIRVEAKLRDFPQPYFPTVDKMKALVSSALSLGNLHVEGPFWYMLTDFVDINTLEKVDITPVPTSYPATTKLGAKVYVQWSVRAAGREVLLPLGQIVPFVVDLKLKELISAIGKFMSPTAAPRAIMSDLQDKAKSLDEKVSDLEARMKIVETDRDKIMKSLDEMKVDIAKGNMEMLKVSESLGVMSDRLMDKLNALGFELQELKKVPLEPAWTKTGRNAKRSAAMKRAWENKKAKKVGDNASNGILATESKDDTAKVVVSDTDSD